MECVVRARDWRCGVRISKKADGRDVRREAAQNCGICAIFRMDSSGGVGFVDVARSIIDGAKTEETRCAVDAFLLAVTVREGGCTWQELGRSAASLPPSRGNVWSPPGHHQGTTVGIPHAQKNWTGVHIVFSTCPDASTRPRRYDLQADARPGRGTLGARCRLWSCVRRPHRGHQPPVVVVGGDQS